MSNYSSNTSRSAKRISIAPMMAYTDRHFRYFFRLISKHVFLYTEMYTIHELLRKDAARILAYHDREHPLALQLGGSDPINLARCGKIGEDLGYDEINLNIGCPSHKVQQGRIGACLMNSPELVAECVSQIKQSVSIPVTIKCRLGIDKTDDYEFLHNFVDKVAAAGCELFIVHARKAWLKGLNPKQNRTVPPLNYEQVYQLKNNFPHLTIILNGGIKDINEIQHHCERVDGVMIGREAYSNPYFLREVDQLFYGSTEPALCREEIALHFIPYLQQQASEGPKLSGIIKHLVGLFHGVERAKVWRKTLIEGVKEAKNGSEVIFRAIAAMK